VNFNAGYNLLAVNPIVECFTRDLVPEYCQGLESSMVNTPPPFFKQSLHGCSNRSLSRLPLHIHVEEIILIYSTLNINIGLCIPKALTLTRLWSYEMVEFWLIVWINNSVFLRRILSFHQLSDAFPYQLARGIPLKEGVPYPLQSKVRTPPPHLRWTILTFQISLNAWLPPHRYTVTVNKYSNRHPIFKQS